MSLLALTIILVVVGSHDGNAVTMRTYDLNEVVASPEWATVLRNRNAHDLVEQRASEAAEATTTVRAGAVTGTTDPGPTAIAWRPEVERWRTLVARYFGTDTERALALIRCESVGDPDAHNPAGPVSGLFQHRDRYWASRSAEAGWAGHGIFEPEANIAVAAWLVYHGGGWSHWSGAAWGIDSCLEWAQAQGV